jgi:hypothetical protein
MVKDDVLSGKMEWTKDIAVGLYDSIADQVNESFPAFCERAFHVTRKQGELIKGGRELVALKGLFIKKKRYAVLIYDMEGHRLDTHGTPGKVKAMGLDLKRSDTPKVIQDFLSDILLSVLTGADRETIITKVRDFKLIFTERPAWEKGTPKRVNNLTKYSKEEERLGKANMPGHVRAALNWNNLRRMNGDKYALQIVDGMKVIICKLKNNPLGFTSVAYPTDELRLPKWFQDLPFDHAGMEEAIINNKVENLIGVLEYDLESTYRDTTFNDLFSFE